jgi:hypothetical protein
LTNKTQKQSIVILLISLILSGCNVLSSLNASPTDPLLMTPEEVVESFYNWYMQYPGNPLVDGAYQNSIYLSEECIDGIRDTLSSFEKSGIDILVCAQDIPDTLFIQPAIISGEKAQIDVKTSFEGHSIKVYLQKNDEEWRITRFGCQ